MRSRAPDLNLTSGGYFTSGYTRSNTTHSSASTTKTNTLPSGPTDPPVSQRGPCKEECSRCPGAIAAAVGDGIRIALAPIPRRMKADREPQVPGAPQGQAEEKADQIAPRMPTQLLAGLLPGEAPETERKQTAAGQKPMPSVSVNWV